MEPSRDYSSFNVFDPISCLTRSNESNFAVISHENTKLIHQSIFDVWTNATYRACTSSGFPFCDKNIKHLKAIREKEVPGHAGDLPVPFPNIIVTSSKIKVPPKFQDRVVYSHNSLGGAEANFDELKICVENTITDLKHKTSQDLAAIVILSDKKNSIHDFVLYADFLSSPRLTSLCCDIPVYFLCCESCIFYIPPGNSTILTKKCQAEWCSLVPVEEDAVVTTEGLKWNLDSDEMGFGKMISTSNELDRDADVLISTNKPLIWSMAFKY